MLTGPPRPSSAGEWRTTASGSTLHLAAGSTRFEEIETACAALRDLALPGVWPVIGVVRPDGSDGSDGPDGPGGPGGSAQLETEAPLHPTLDELLASDLQIDPLAAAGLLNEINQTLIALSRAGWQHASLDAESVVFGADGIARLVDAGVAIVRGPADASTYAGVIDRVAATWGGTSAAGLRAVAGTARADGLEAALVALGRLARSLPPVADRRDVLRAAVAAATTVPTSSDVPRAAGATLLGRRQRGSDPAMPMQRVHGQTSDEIRFGPGVHAPAATLPAALTRSRRRRSRVAGSVGLLLTAGVAGLLWWLLHQPDPLTVSSVRSSQVAPSIGCDGSARLTATVATRGSGQIDYHWRRSDGADSGPLHEDVTPGERSVTLVLRWRVEGHGGFHGEATAEITAPTELSATTAFDYTCP